MSYTLIEYPKEHKQEERTYPLYFFWGERIRLFEKRTTCYLLNTDHDSCNDLHVVYDNNCDDNQIKTSSMTTTFLTAQRLILPKLIQSTHLFNHCKRNTKTRRTTRRKSDFLQTLILPILSPFENDRLVSPETKTISDNLVPTMETILRISYNLNVIHVFKTIVETKRNKQHLTRVVTFAVHFCFSSIFGGGIIRLSTKITNKNKGYRRHQR